MAEKFSPTISTTLPGYSRGAAIGENIGTGLGQGLQFLLQDKMNRMMQAKQQQKISSGLESLLGISPDQATALSGVPEPLLRAIIPQMQKQQQTNKLMKQYQEGGVSGGGVEGAGRQDSGSEFQRVLAMTGGDVQAALKAEADAKKMKLEERKFKFKQKQEQKKVSVAEQSNIDKETLPFYKDVIKDHKSTKENERRLGRMEEIVRKGKLDSPIASSLLDRASKGIFGFGLNLDAWRSPDSQEFQKLSTEFLKGAKAIFGARVTTREMEMFLKMLPTLVQSDKGKLRVINNMRAYNKAELLKKDAMDNIIKQNRGKRPRHLGSLVESAIAPKLDRLSQEFKRGYKIDLAPKEDKSSFVRRSRAWLSDMPFNL